jgi:hypothetical protein
MWKAEVPCASGTYIVHLIGDVDENNDKNKSENTVTRRR